MPSGRLCESSASYMQQGDCELGEVALAPKKPKESLSQGVALPRSRDVILQLLWRIGASSRPRVDSGPPEAATVTLKGHMVRFLEAFYSAI